jgi:hypothetical protein
MLEETQENGRKALQRLVVENQELELLETKLAQFNLFEALGAVRQELRHSCFLAFLFDPRENHGLGDEFARRFLKRVAAEHPDLPVSAIDVDVWDLNELEVRREWRNVDILLLEHTKRLAVIIENKIDSQEGGDQLERYHKGISRSFEGYRIVGIFLTPDGGNPSNDLYVPIGYEAVAETIEAIATRRASTVGVDVHTLLVHYVEMLRRHIVSDSPIAELCQEIYRKHRDALDLIYEHRPDQQVAIAEILKGLVEGEKSKLVLDHSSKSYVRFGLQRWDVPLLLSGEGWTPSGRILLFEFNNSSNRLMLGLYIGPSADINTRQRLFDVAKRGDTPLRPDYKSLNQKWNIIYKKQFLSAKDYDEGTIEIVKERVRLRWAGFLENDLPKIEAIIQSENWLWELTVLSGPRTA